MHFLTSLSTLHIRNLVGKLQIRMDIAHDLYLFVKARGDDLLLSSPIRYDSSSPSSITSNQDVKMNLGAHRRATSTAGEVFKVCDANHVLHFDKSDNKSELLCLCLQTCTSHAKTSKILEFVDPLQTGAKDHASLRPRSNASIDKSVPLGNIGCLDRSKPAVTQSITPEKSTFTGCVDSANAPGDAMRTILSLSFPCLTRTKMHPRKPR